MTVSYSMYRMLSVFIHRIDLQQRKLPTTMEVNKQEAEDTPGRIEGSYNDGLDQGGLDTSHLGENEK